MKFVTGIFALVAMSLSSVSFAETNIEHRCGESSVPTEWTYCISETIGSSNRDIMYYYHGALGSVRTWVDSGHARAIRERWEAQGKEAPIVVNISFGPRWVLTSPNSSPYSGLFEVVTQMIMPIVESEMVDSFSGRRILMGFSMGGANVTQLALKTPELFSRATIACPAILSMSPHAGEAEITAFLARTGADREKVVDMLQTARQIFPTEADWDNFMPLGLAKNLFGTHTPAMYISCGKTDEYGFYDDTKELARIAKAKEVDAVWQSLAGSHCAYDINAIADFILD